MSVRIEIPKSQKTIKDEERQARINNIRKSTPSVSLQDLKQLLLDIYDELKGNQ